MVSESGEQLEKSQSGALPVLKHAFTQARDENIELDNPAATQRLFKLSEGIQEAVVQDNRFPGPATQMVRSLDGGSSGFYPHLMAMPLLRRALRTGSPQEALDWLQKVLETHSATGKTVEALWGVRVDDEILLTADVKIVPIEKIPESPQKQWITQRDIHSSPIGHALNFFPPSSALIVNRRIEPFITEAGHLNESEMRELSDIYALLDDISLSLTIVGPRVVISAGRWSIFDDADLQEAVIGYSRTWGHLEILPSRPLDYPMLDPREAQNVVSSYIALRGETKSKVRVALQRLSQAQRRQSVGDQAVELATAFETLLGDGNTEMTHKIRVRAARIVGGSKSERIENAALVNSMYSLRSKLVHTGQVDPAGTEKIGKSRISRTEVLTSSVKICAKILLNIIEDGAIPNWSEFDITEHNEIRGEAS